MIDILLKTLVLVNKGKNKYNINKLLIYKIIILVNLKYSEKNLLSSNELKISKFFDI